METKGMKKGDKVSVIVYSGRSKAEADAVYNYLNDHYERLKPAPLNGTEFKLKVLSVERRDVPNDNVVDLTKIDTILDETERSVNTVHHYPREEILMKGELL